MLIPLVLELSELAELLVSPGVVPEEELLIGGVGLHPLPHEGVVQQGKIGRELKEGRIGLLVKELLEVAGKSKKRRFGKHKK